MQNEIKLDKSLAWRERAEAVIPMGTQTFSKAPSAFSQGNTPVVAVRGEGSRIYDADGNSWIDYLMGLGPILLGYNYPAVNDAVERQLKESGPLLSLPHPLETELAEKLVELIPCAEMVRYGKNGSDATSGSVRVARAYTGREKIAFCGYHGWQDWYVAATVRDLGTPEHLKSLMFQFTYNDIDSLDQIFKQNPDEIAAVIMEPFGGIIPEDNFLQKVKDLAHENGAVLIFDEVITGFRMGLGGAQEYFGVTPDLACLGKAVGNGFPISVIAGKREIMELMSKIFYSFTFGGEIISLAAAIAVIDVLQNNPVYEHLTAIGKRLKDGFNELAQKHGAEQFAVCNGVDQKSVVAFSPIEGYSVPQIKSLFQQEVIKRGVLFNGNHFFSFSHSQEDIDQTLNAYDDSLAILSEAVKNKKLESLLEGPVVQPVFTRP